MNKALEEESSPLLDIDERQMWAEVKRRLGLFQRAENRQTWLLYASAVPALALSSSPLAAVPVLAAAELGRLNRRRSAAYANTLLCPRCHQPFLEINYLRRGNPGPYRVFSKSADCRHCGLTVGETYFTAIGSPPLPANFDEEATWTELKRRLELYMQGYNWWFGLLLASAIPSLLLWVLSPSSFLPLVPVAAALALGILWMRRAGNHVNSLLCPRCGHPFMEIDYQTNMTPRSLLAHRKSVECQHCGLAVGESKTQ